MAYFGKVFLQDSFLSLKVKAHLNVFSADVLLLTCAVKGAEKE